MIDFIKCILLTYYKYILPIHFHFLTSTWKEERIEELCTEKGDVRQEREVLGGKQANNTFYVRTVTNQLRYGPLSKDFLPVSSPVNLYANNTMGLYELGLNSLATDYLDEDQVKNHIWTWDPSLSIESIDLKSNTFCTALNRDSLRWTVRPCRETHPILCQHTSNRTCFVLGGYVSNPHLFIPSLHRPTKTYQNLTRICPLHFQFQPPISAYVFFQN